MYGSFRQLIIKVFCLSSDGCSKYTHLSHLYPSLALHHILHVKLTLVEKNSGVKVQDIFKINLPSQIIPEAGCHGNKINFFLVSTQKENKQ